jgi:hypothetical protein
MHRRGLGGTSELAPWPSLPRNLGAPGRFFYAYVFLAAVPDVRRWHRQRNIPDDVSWATLADLGRHLPVNRRVHGEGGLDRPLWLRSHFRGALYQLGRLQFCRSRIPYEPAMLEHLAVPFRYGDPALDLHIPEQGPLTPPPAIARCDGPVISSRGTFLPSDPFDEPTFRLGQPQLLRKELA